MVDKELEFESSSQWRKWLSENYKTFDSIWLVIYKKSNRGFSYNQALEGALCFGWIDSKPRKRDDDSYLILFSKRNQKSNWSRKNKEITNRFIEEGRMTEAGFELINIAKETGKWDALVEVQNSIVPDDLSEQLKLNPLANENFDKFPPSSKRIILEWILNAKTRITRQNRINETVR